MAEGQVSNANHEELIRKVDDLEKRLQTKDAEIQVYKMLMSQMEEEAATAKKYKALHEKQTQDVDGLRTESEKTLTKAKSMIFEKTKIIKNQELQIEAFTQQIESLREVVRITKDLLEIRNMEVKQLEIKIESIEGKQKAEKERYDLMHKKLEMMIRHNAELKREYETQLCLFTALRERYSERELAKDVIENLKTPTLKIASQNENNTTQKEISVVPNQEKSIESTVEDKQKSAAEQNTTATVESAPPKNQPEFDKAVPVDQNKNATPTEQIAPKTEDSIPVPNEVVPEPSKLENNVVEPNKQTETNNNTNSSEQKAQEPVITAPETVIKQETATGQSNTISEQTVVKTEASVAAPVDQTNQNTVAQPANVVQSPLASDVPAAASVDSNPVNKEVSPNEGASQTTNEAPVVAPVDNDLVNVSAPAPQVANVEKKE
uniref:110 kDa antigen n=1 Tax=Diabrotica virgifera virgifera TaxID=50390 RepID=A0A6P7G939_DIAVI